MAEHITVAAGYSVTQQHHCCGSLASSGYGGGLMERMELPRRGGGGWGVGRWGGGVHLTKGSLAISVVEPTCHDRLLNTKTGPHKFVGF